AGHPRRPAAGGGCQRVTRPAGTSVAMQLVTGSAGDAVLDMAVSEALLRAREPAARVYRPRPTLAFGRLDRIAGGYERAAAAAAAHGFDPVLRLGGGRAAAYDSGSVVVDVVVPAS